MGECFSQAYSILVPLQANFTSSFPIGNATPACNADKI